MDFIKKSLPFFCVLLAILLIAATASAKQKKSAPCSLEYSSPGACAQMESAEVKTSDEENSDGGEKDEEEYKWEDEGELFGQTYKRLFYTFGFGGHYFAKKDGVDISGTSGALTNLEYRFSKIVSVGFDMYYGWLIGEGNQYWSAFNPGVKIFPMAYRNPRFEPYIFLGGHAFDGAFGGSDRNNLSMGQGGFAGLGFKWFSETGMFGAEAFIRASFLYMERPNLPGRGLAIPIFFFLGFAR